MHKHIYETARVFLFIALISAVIGWAGPTMAGHEFDDFKGKSPLADGDDGDVEYPSSVSKFELEAELELPDDIKGKVPAMIIAHKAISAATLGDTCCRYVIWISRAYLVLLLKLGRGFGEKE